jgi:hypothetical protein
MTKILKLILMPSQCDGPGTPHYLSKGPKRLVKIYSKLYKTIWVMDFSEARTESRSFYRIETHRHWDVFVIGIADEHI